MILLFKYQYIREPTYVRDVVQEEFPEYRYVNYEDLCLHDLKTEFIAEYTKPRVYSPWLYLIRCEDNNLENEIMIRFRKIGFRRIYK